MAGRVLISFSILFCCWNNIFINIGLAYIAISNLKCYCFYNTTKQRFGDICFSKDISVAFLISCSFIQCILSFNSDPYPDIVLLKYIFELGKTALELSCILIVSTDLINEIKLGKCLQTLCPN